MTLAEIMVVVALIGVIGMWMLNFDFETATDKERRDRFVTQTSSLIRHMKTASVSGRTSIVGNCGGYVLEIWPLALTWSSASFTETWSVSNVCWTDKDASLLAPMLGDSQAYSVNAVTAYSSDGTQQFRVSKTGDYTGNVGTAAKSVALLVNGSNLAAYPLTCGIPATCVDYSFGKSVRLKLNLWYRQAVSTRNKLASKDLFIDLRTGNVEVKDPVSP